MHRSNCRISSLISSRYFATDSEKYNTPSMSQTSIYTLTTFCRRFEYDFHFSILLPNRSNHITNSLNQSKENNNSEDDATNTSEIGHQAVLKDASFKRNISGACASNQQNVDNIDAESWLVCSKVWKLLDSELNDDDEDLLEHRLTEIRVSVCNTKRYRNIDHVIIYFHKFFDKTFLRKTFFRRTDDEIRKRKAKTSSPVWKKHC